MQKVARNTLIYTAVTILQRAAIVLLVPLYTRYLTTEQFGIVGSISSILNVLTILAGLSLRSAAVRFYHTNRDQPERAREMWGTLFYFTLGSSLTLALILLLFHRATIDRVLGSIPFSPYMLIGLATLAFNPAYQIYQASLQTRQQGRRFGMNNLAFFLANTLLAIGFLLATGMRAEGVLLAGAVTNAAFLVYSAVVFHADIGFRFSRRALAAALRYSLPLLPHAIAVWIMTMIDKVLVNKMISTSAAGVFEVGSQIGNIVNLLVFSINLAIGPYFFEQWGRGKTGRRLIAETSETTVALCVLTAFALSLFSFEIVRLIASEPYQEAWQVVGLISFGFVFVGIYNMTGVAIWIDRTYLVAFVTIAGAIVKIGLSILLVPRFGMIGASTSTTTSLAVMSVLTLVVSQRVQSVPYRVLPLFGVPLVGLSMSLAVAFFQSSLGRLDAMLVLVKATMLAAAAAGVYVMNRSRFRALLAAGQNAAKRAMPGPDDG